MNKYLEKVAGWEELNSSVHMHLPTGVLAMQHNDSLRSIDEYNLAKTQVLKDYLSKGGEHTADYAKVRERLLNKYLNKQAELSEDTKKEIAQTGVLAAVGGATGYLGHKLLETNPIKRMKMSGGAKSALAMGGLGLLGDIAAVKVNRNIEKKANEEMSNRYLEKVAEAYNISPHSLDRDMGIKSVNMSNMDFDKYREGQSEYLTPGRMTGHLGVGAALGAGAGYLAGGRGQGAVIGGLLGALIAGGHLDRKSHDIGHEHAGTARMLREYAQEEGQ